VFALQQRPRVVPPSLVAKPKPTSVRFAGSKGQAARVSPNRASTIVGYGPSRPAATNPVDVVARGFADPSQPLPHIARIQASFGPYDVTGVAAHRGTQAQATNAQLGSTAYASGEDVAFAGTPDLRTAAHEAAHVIQQRAGVELAGGVGMPADRFERHAEAVAERVASGASAVELLDGCSGGANRVPALQKRDGSETPDHSAAEAAGNVSISVGADMTAEAALRAVYEQGARQITEEALRQAAAAGNTPEAIDQAARWAVQARNDLKAAIRAQGSVVTKALAEARNIKKYGDKIGPTYDQLIREGKTPKDIIGSSGRANTKLTRAATKLRVAGRFLIAVDLAIVTWEVLEAPEGSRLRTAAGGAGGIAGALAVGELGAVGGAKVGGAIGTFVEPGGGTAVGAAIGGIIGGIGGAIAGGFFGKKGGEKLYDVAEDLFAPNIDADMQKIDTAQDALIRGAR
jgi:hypothetical protein